jgi:hypothetical protein
MSEKIKIVIEAPEAHPEYLTIRDAMEQVLDYFQLASIGDPNSQNIVWKLVSVSMKSPFTVTGEAMSLDPAINTDVIARRQKDRFRTGIKSLLDGVTPHDWTSGEANKIVERVLKRNKNGIGKTKLFMDFKRKSVPIEITPQLADFVIIEIHKLPSRLFAEDSAHKELGSVDGYLVAAGSDHGKPAIRIQDRLTKREIWCRVPEETRDSISKVMQLDDVWKHRRVIVSGLIQYEKDGDLSRIYEASIEFLDTREISLDKIRDKGFTQGMSPSEYLDKLREGNLE